MNATHSKETPVGGCLERLVRHLTMMAPHQKDRTGGKLLLEAAGEIERLRFHLRAVLNLTVSDGAAKIVEVTTAAEKALTPNDQAEARRTEGVRTP